MVWTPERKDALRSMWQEGRSSREIADALGEVTRNAVMGMVNRMGLMGDAGHNAKMKGPAYGACRPKTASTDVVANEGVVATMTSEAALATTPSVAAAAASGTADVVADAAEDMDATMQADASDSRDPAASIGVGDAETESRSQDDVADRSPTFAHSRDVGRMVPARPRRDRKPGEPVDRRILVGPLLGSRPVPQRAAPEKPKRSIVRVPTDGSHPVDWKVALTLVEEITGRVYDPSVPGHRASLVAIGTILARGDPRKVLMPYLPEQQIVSVMRMLAEKGIVVGGKTPQTWLDPDNGDVAFTIDMLIAEGVLKPKAHAKGGEAREAA